MHPIQNQNLTNSIGWTTLISFPTKRPVTSKATNSSTTMVTYPISQSNDQCVTGQSILLHLAPTNHSTCSLNSQQTFLINPHSAVLPQRPGEGATNPLACPTLLPATSTVVSQHNRMGGYQNSHQLECNLNNNQINATQHVTTTNAHQCQSIRPSVRPELPYPRPPCYRLHSRQQLGDHTPGSLVSPVTASTQPNLTTPIHPMLCRRRGDQLWLTSLSHSLQQTERNTSLPVSTLATAAGQSVSRAIVPPSSLIVNDQTSPSCFSLISSPSPEQIVGTSTNVDNSDRVTIVTTQAPVNSVGDSVRVSTNQQVTKLASTNNTGEQMVIDDAAIAGNASVKVTNPQLQSSDKRSSDSPGQSCWGKLFFDCDGNIIIPGLPGIVLPGLDSVVNDLGLDVDNYTIDDCERSDLEKFMLTLPPLSTNPRNEIRPVGQLMQNSGLPVYPRKGHHICPGCSSLFSSQCAFQSHINRPIASFTYQCHLCQIESTNRQSTSEQLTQGHSAVECQLTATNLCAFHLHFTHRHPKEPTSRRTIKPELLTIKPLSSLKGSTITTHAINGVGSSDRNYQQGSDLESIERSRSSTVIQLNDPDADYVNACLELGGVINDTILRSSVNPLDVDSSYFSPPSSTTPGRYFELPRGNLPLFEALIYLANRSVGLNHSTLPPDLWMMQGQIVQCDLREQVTIPPAPSLVEEMNRRTECDNNGPIGNTHGVRSPQCLVCSLQFVSDDQLAEHLSPPVRSTPVEGDKRAHIACPFCGHLVVYNQRLRCSLKAHLLLHLNLFAMCPDCGFTPPSWLSPGLAELCMRLHLRYACFHFNRLLLHACRHCSSHFQSIDELTRHQMKSHATQRYSCLWCCQCDDNISSNNKRKSYDFNGRLDKNEVGDIERLTKQPAFTHLRWVRRHIERRHASLLGSRSPVANDLVEPTSTARILTDTRSRVGEEVNDPEPRVKTVKLVQGIDYVHGFQCVVCTYVAPNENRFLTHFKLNHQDLYEAKVYYTCFQPCNSVFDSLVDLRSHASQCSANQLPARLGELEKRQDQKRSSGTSSDHNKEVSPNYQSMALCLYCEWTHSTNDSYIHKVTSRPCNTENQNDVTQNDPSSSNLSESKSSSGPIQLTTLHRHEVASHCQLASRPGKSNLPCPWCQVGLELHDERIASHLFKHLHENAYFDWAYQRMVRWMNKDENQLFCYCTHALLDSPFTLLAHSSNHLMRLITTPSSSKVNDGRPADYNSPFRRQSTAKRDLENNDGGDVLGPSVGAHVACSHLVYRHLRFREHPHLDSIFNMNESLNDQLTFTCKLCHVQLSTRWALTEHVFVDHWGTMCYVCCSFRLPEDRSASHSSQLNPTHSSLPPTNSSSAKPFSPANSPPLPTSSDQQSCGRGNSGDQSSFWSHLFACMTERETMLRQTRVDATTSSIDHRRKEKQESSVASFLEHWLVVNDRDDLGGGNRTNAETVNRMSFRVNRGVEAGGNLTSFSDQADSSSRMEDPTDVIIIDSPSPSQPEQLSPRIGVSPPRSSLSTRPTIKKVRGKGKQNKSTDIKLLQPQRTANESNVQNQPSTVQQPMSSNNTSTVDATLMNPTVKTESTQSNWKEWKRIKRYVTCPTCLQCFSSPAWLKRHRLRKHSESMLDSPVPKVRRKVLSVKTGEPPLEWLSQTPSPHLPVSKMVKKVPQSLLSEPLPPSTSSSS